MQNINEITVTQGQSFFDIAIQHAGAPEAAIQLAEINGMSITETLATGQTLEPVNISNKRVYNYYTANNIKPATDCSAIEEGIEFWYVEYDFVVS
jgi:hypothetical protein